MATYTDLKDETLEEWKERLESQEQSYINLPMDKEEYENFCNELIKEENENQEDEYFQESKLSRDTMYSQTLETYQKILNNSNYYLYSILLHSNLFRNLEDP